MSEESDRPVVGKIKGEIKIISLPRVFYFLGARTVSSSEEAAVITVDSEVFLRSGVSFT